MTQEDIIKLMREAGFVANVSVEHWGNVPFAKLCHPTPTSTSLYHMLESLIKRATAAEREACAKVCDVLSVHPEYASDITKLAASAIRARGETEDTRNE
jgi:hypothetical protein